ncbi:DUF6288 domain-containing protein [Haloferula sp. A504]|uniref:DUF6288 domain-containing protein n=1 Tax=Haloferula sp. A504 TaxID=3373601 RepID=UPI0031C12F85|nr:DUF6288 domain-containing protein [Verrucomicrobiaceae bacterium E54]
MRACRRQLEPLGNGIVLCLAALVGLTGAALGIKDPDNQGRWEQPCKDGPDAEVPGFLVNMGPTGARGILKERAFVVKYIFAKSPAKGVLEIDDEVYGANGKRFPAHTFGGGNHGIEGPIQDLGLAIEDSEGEDGVLKLMVKRAGENLEVDVQLEVLGRFADSFPVDCEKTRVLKARAEEYLIEHFGGVSSQGRCVATLALLSSDDPKAARAGKRMALEWNEPQGETTWSWHLGFQGITLAEYYLLTGDRKVLKTLESTMELLEAAQWKTPIHHWKSEQIKGIDQAIIDKHQALYEGGFGHAPYSVIVERGGGGYGPMQWPTCLALMTWELSKQCGLEVDQEAVDRSFTFLDHGTTNAGKIAYGGEFTLNNGPVDWKSWKANTRHGASHKSGLGYLVHQLSPERPESKKMKKLHLENIEAAYKDMPDGHACAMMGLTWGWAGTFASDDRKLRETVADYYKAWINMARCHGSDSYVILPARDYADGSYYRGNIRAHTTAAVAFLYSYSSPKLRVHGVDGSAAETADSTSRLPESNLGELRTFRNADRSRSFDGRLVGFDPASGIVRISLKHGGTRDLEFMAFSEEDQEYLKAQLVPEE